MLRKNLLLGYLPLWLLICVLFAQDSSAVKSSAAESTVAESTVAESTVAESTAAKTNLATILGVNIVHSAWHDR